MTELARIETVVFLQSADVFAFCKAEEVLRIAAIARQRQLRSGEKIYEVNDPAGALFCVVQGSVELEHREGKTTLLGPLKTFGVSDILSGKLRADSAKAVDETLVLEIDAEDFFDLLANNIEIVKALFRYLLGDGRQRLFH